MFALSHCLSLPLTICCLSGVLAQVMNFTCQVRTQHTQPLTLSNRSNQRWTLKPLIEGQHWTGAPSFILEPYQQNKVYEVVYKPMVMTTDGKKHQVLYRMCLFCLCVYVCLCVIQWRLIGASLPGSSSSAWPLFSTQASAFPVLSFNSLSLHGWLK